MNFASTRDDMRLAEYTDYTLRVLMYCAANPQRLVTIGELADHHGVSKNHLMKVVNALARQGLLETTRGRGGGLRLLKDAASIRIGDVVRASETDFRLVECFDPKVNNCRLTPTCRLKRVLASALDAYLRVLDSATLADISGPGEPSLPGQSIPLHQNLAPAAAAAAAAVRSADAAERSIDAPRPELNVYGGKPRSPASASMRSRPATKRGSVATQ
jgi:Rrf2 family nitric oxide-sensitive transcriptional repressor